MAASFAENFQGYTKETSPDLCVKLAIFDIDGTLVDSNDYHAKAFDHAFREVLKKEIPFSNIRRLIGMGGDKLIPTLTGIDAESSEGKKISELKKEYFSKQFSNLKAFPKVKELVEALKKCGIQIAIASSAKESEVERFSKMLGIQSLVSSTSSSDEVKSSKPDPDVVEVVLDKLKVDPKEALMIGDTPFDIDAAKKAGVRTIALRCGGYWSDNDFQGAIAIYDSPEDLLNKLEESPFFKGSFCPDA
jgi:HAD superfamily hydrolase (TIGR01662 family)